MHLKQTSCFMWNPVCLPPFGSPSQDIFPPECPTHVGSMSVSPRPSPHHHHTLDALWLPLQCAAWRHQWVPLLLLTSVVSPLLIVGVCDLIPLPLLSKFFFLLNGSWTVLRPIVCSNFRLCCGPDPGSEVCTGHRMWNGLLTHTWTHDPPSLSQQQECYGEYSQPQKLEQYMKSSLFSVHCRANREGKCFLFCHLNVQTISQT